MLSFIAVERRDRKSLKSSAGDFSFCFDLEEPPEGEEDRGV
jgi:hypothetical protein